MNTQDIQLPSNSRFGFFFSAVFAVVAAYFGLNAQINTAVLFGALSFLTAIVSAITVLGSKLGLTVLAEGVERESQLELLAEEGCHEIQGFFFSPPIGPDEVTQLMTEGDGCIQPAHLTN